MTCKNRINLVLEEIVPFIFYFYRVKKKTDEINRIDYPLPNNYQKYEELNREEILSRLKEEHERAQKMDEKTFKLTLSLSIGLTILSSITSLLVRGISTYEIKLAIITSAYLSIFFTLFGGYLALESLRTLPTYGYGTEFLLNSKSETKEPVLNLVKQEKMNIIRHFSVHDKK